MNRNCRVEKEFLSLPIVGEGASRKQYDTSDSARLNSAQLGSAHVPYTTTAVKTPTKKDLRFLQTIRGSWKRFSIGWSEVFD